MAVESLIQDHRILGQCIHSEKDQFEKESVCPDCGKVVSSRLKSLSLISDYFCISLIIRDATTVISTVFTTTGTRSR
jgi:hypothetical protein